MVNLKYMFYHLIQLQLVHKSCSTEWSIYMTCSIISSHCKSCEKAVSSSGQFKLHVLSYHLTTTHAESYLLWAVNLYNMFSYHCFLCGEIITLWSQFKRHVQSDRLHLVIHIKLAIIVLLVRLKIKKNHIFS